MNKCHAGGDIVPFDLSSFNVQLLKVDDYGWKQHFCASDILRFVVSRFALPTLLFLRLDHHCLLFADEVL